MNCAYVCASCRRQIPRQLPRNLTSYKNNNASFTSLDNPKSARRRGIFNKRDDFGAQDQVERARHEFHTLDSIEDDFLQRLLRDRKAGSGPYSSPRSRKDPLTSEKLPNDTLFTFEETGLHDARVVPQNAAKRHSEESTTQFDAISQDIPVSRDEASSEHELRMRRAMEVIVDTNASLGDTWTAYMDVILSGETSKFVLRSVSKKIATRWSQEEPGELLLAPSVVFQRLERDAIKFSLAHWRSTLLGTLLSATTRMEHSSETLAAPPIESLCREIVDLWNLFLERFVRSEFRETWTHFRIKDRKLSRVDAKVQWKTLSNSKDMNSIRSWSSRNFAARFRAFFPKPRAYSHRPDEILAVASYAVLRVYLRTRPIEEDSIVFEPFMEFMAQLLTHAEVSSYTSDGALNEVNLNGDSTRSIQLLFLMRKELQHPVHLVAKQSSILGNFGGALSKATASKTESSSRSFDHAAARPEMISKRKALEQNAQLGMLQTRVGRAIKKEDLPLLEKLWKETEIALADAGYTKSDAEVSALCSQFLLGFMAMRRPQRAIDVWNTVLQRHITPSIQMWDTMLRGCGEMRDARGVDQIWKMMIASKTRPDAHIWASRIQGLTKGGSWSSGMRAFEEMLKNWLRAARLQLSAAATVTDIAAVGDVEEHPKPTTEAVNGLIAGLSRARRGAEIAKVLSWAKSIGIDPDAYTFNMLLKPSLRDRDEVRVQELMEMMRTQGIKPDIATFTMFLESLFRNDATDETNEAELRAKQSAAADLLRSIEAYGIEANAWTFSTIINGLLKMDGKSARGNIEAAYATFTHMIEKKIPLSSQVFTSLISYHFSQQPQPNLVAVDALWERARMEENLKLDNIFFDRLIEGFARCGQVGRMKTALAQAGKRGKAPGWVALAEAVRALAVNGDRASVEELLANVRKEEQLGEAFRFRMGKKMFFETVQELGFDTHGIATLGDDRHPPVSKMQAD